MLFGKLKEKEKNERVEVEKEKYDVNYFLDMAKKMEYRGPEHEDDIQFHKGGSKGYRKVPQHQ